MSALDTPKAAQMPGHTRPRLPVMITNYNYEKFVATAINSLLDQAEDIEIIVIDDCSSDNTRAIISGFDDKVTRVFQDVN